MGRVSSIKKEAGMEVPKTCILSFGQQELPKLVANKLSKWEKAKFIPT